MSEPKKNICFVNTTKSWGGGEKWHFDAALNLAQNGNKVFFIGQIGGVLQSRLSEHKINTELYDVSNLSFLNPLKIIKLRTYFKKNNIQIVVLNLPSDLKLAGIAAKLAGVKKIIYRRGSAIPIKNRFLNRVLLKNVTTHILANSEKTKQTILSIKENFLNPDKITVIYNGIDLKNFEIRKSGETDFESRDIIIGNVGRMVYQKGQEYLIELGRILSEKKIPFKIIIAGDGSLKNRLEREVSKLGLEDKILFPGFCKDVPSFMGSIDIFVLSSRWEGFGYVITEAMACRKPVIAFNLSSNPELVEDGKTGFLITPFNIILMADKIIELYKNKSEIERLGNNGRKKVESQFDSRIIMNEIGKYLLGN
ncbi:MAG: glycosyltransferase [Melioribacteraceae bacterium]|nr:glycosyltransferase [Melioribacteraceae bacterium]